MPGTIARDSGGVYVEGVPRFSYGPERDSFIQSLRAAAMALGRSMPYHLLKGFSAAAFRLIFHPGWQRYSPDALCGYDHTGLAFGCLGLAASACQADPAEPGAVAQVRRAIVHSIQRGYPALALRLMAWDDWGVVAGYAQDGQVLLCRTPHDQSGDLVPHQQWPRLTLLIAGEGPLPDPKVAVLRSLRAAVDLFETERFGPYYSGRAAYGCWIAGLKDGAAYLQLGEREGQDYRAWISRVQLNDADNLRADAPYASKYLERVHVNHRRLEGLLDARREAARYLGAAAALFGKPAAARLTQAGDLYAEASELLGRARTWAPSEWELEGNPWTQEKRDAQARTLAKVLALEERAIEAIKGAL